MTEVVEDSGESEAGIEFFKTLVKIQRLEPQPAQAFSEVAYHVGQTIIADKEQLQREILFYIVDPELLHITFITRHGLRIVFSYERVVDMASVSISLCF